MRRPSGLGEAEVQAFETEGLIGTAAAPAVLAYLFHRIEGRLDGRPTLLIIDEGWLALDDEGFAGQLREWLKTLRKKNASVDLRHAIAVGHRRLRDRARHHRELPDAAVPAERAGDRAADHRDLSPLRPQRPPDRDPRPRDAEARLLLPVAARQSAVRARSRRRRARLHRGVLQVRPGRYRAHARRTWPRRVRCRLAAPRGLAWAADLIPDSPNHGEITMIAIRRLAAASAVALVDRLRNAAVFGAVDRVRSEQLRAERADSRARAAADQQPDHLAAESSADADQPGAAISRACHIRRCSSLQSSIQRTQQLLAQAQRIAYNVQQIDHAFSDHLRRR